MSEYDIFQKLEILTDAAKYDVACTSSGVDRPAVPGKLGSAVKEKATQPQWLQSLPKAKRRKLRWKKPQKSGSSRARAGKETPPLSWPFSPKARKANPRWKASPGNGNSATEREKATRPRLQPFSPKARKANPRWKAMPRNGRLLEAQPTLLHF